MRNDWRFSKVLLFLLRVPADPIIRASHQVPFICSHININQTLGETEGLGAFICRPLLILSHSKPVIVLNVLDGCQYEDVKV